MSTLNSIHAFALAIRSAKRRSQPRERLWRLVTGAACLLLGCLLCLPLAVIFEMEEATLRLNLLNLLAGLGVLVWIIAGTVLRLNMSIIFDYRAFLPLPIGFKTLFGARIIVGLVGLWMPIFGPGLIYLLVSRTTALLGFVVALLALLALVVLLGRLVAISILLFHHLAASWVVTLVLLTIIAATLFALEPTIQSLLLGTSEEATPGQVATQISDSRLLAAMAYFPSGLLVGILNAPQEVGTNLGRLAGLWCAALACLTLEYHLLRHRLLGRITGATRTDGVHASLAPFLRRARHLSPEVCLVLIELETLMRSKWYREMMLAVLFLMPVVQTGSVYVLLGAIVLVSASFLNVRSHSYGVAHRSIRQRFAMPVRLIASASTYSAAASVLPGVAFAATVGWSLYRVGWPGLGIVSLWLTIPFCALVGSRGADVYESARTPSPFDFTPYGGRLPASSPRWPSAVFKLAIIGLPSLLAFLVQKVSWGSAAAVCGAGILMIGSIAFNARMMSSADRLVRSDPHRILRRLSTSSANSGT